MSTILPEGEGIRRAVKWISEQRKSEPDTPISQLVHAAIAQFVLSPKDGMALIQFYQQVRDQAPGSERD
ncbi:MAG: hypothetical protein H6695_04135 [Deferribacteres bacterium]|nr:hypothetical protein [candidate division KSB1 bacterium]MCB9509341.1 hypothetical protein [Deferribacteres bacterium]